MRSLLIIVLFLLFPALLFSQASGNYFSDAIKVDFQKYSKKTALAYKNKDLERGRFLFDSLVDHRLAGTTFDDFIFKKASGATLKLSTIKKPTVLITYASWCVPTQGEIPALNKLAQKYGKDVKIVVLFWDKKHNIKKFAAKFCSRITVCYAHESYKNDAPVVSALKHTLEFPTCFYLDEKRTVIDIRRCGIYQSPKKSNYNKSYALNYNSFLDGFATILINKQLSKEHLAIK